MTRQGLPKTTAGWFSPAGLSEVFSEELSEDGWSYALSGAIVLTATIGILQRPMSFSVWESVGGIFGRVLLAFLLGRALIRWYLPRYVAHGQTRRQFTGPAAVTALSYTAAGAGVMAAGLWAESVVYGAFGRAHLPLFSHLFDAPHQAWLVALEYWLVFAVWAAAGALVTACVRDLRSPRGAVRAGAGVVLAAALVVVAEGAVGAPLYVGEVAVAAGLPVAASVAVCAAVAVVGFAATRVAVHHLTFCEGGST